MKTPRLFFILLAILPLMSCQSLNPYDESSDCPDPFKGDCVSMKTAYRRFTLILPFAMLPWAVGAEIERSGSPADDLPPHITRLTWFGERADWSHDGNRILFLSKTFGDAMEVDLDGVHELL